MPSDAGGGRVASVCDVVVPTVFWAARCISACVGGWSAAVACDRTSRPRRTNWRNTSRPPTAYMDATANATTAMPHVATRRQRGGAGAVARVALDGGCGSEYNEKGCLAGARLSQPGAAIFL